MNLIWVICRQCCGSMTFWCRSGSAYPCLWLMDPDSDPDHCLQDRKKGLIPYRNMCQVCAAGRAGTAALVRARGQPSAVRLDASRRYATMPVLPSFQSAYRNCDVLNGYGSGSCPFFRSAPSSQDANKKLFFYSTFFYFFPTFTSVFKDYKLSKSHKTVEIQGFSNWFFAYWWTHPDPLLCCIARRPYFIFVQ